MRLSIMTYNIFRKWDLDTLCEELPKAGVVGVEFRTGIGHAHGVEPGISDDERKTVRKKLGEAHLVPVSVATGCRFEDQDPSIVRENIEESKEAIRLASDIGAPRIRVFGNNVPEGEDPEVTADRVGTALAELGPVGEREGVDVLLEMHGNFADWKLCKRAVLRANHRAVACISNCEPSEIVDGSPASVFDEIKSMIRHVHFHDLKGEGYPYRELFELLARDGYSGFMSLEIDFEGDTRAHLHEQAQEFFKLKDALPKEVGRATG